MRKQKVFKRVSAWLLAWTMVLSALAGSVTAWAQEPEEVRVQIEAETDGETETEAEIEAETGNESADNQDGDEQVEQTGLPTGLVAYTDFERNAENKIIGKADGAEPKKELEMDLNGGTLCLAKIKDGTETEIYPTTNEYYQVLIVQKKTGVDNNGNDTWQQVTYRGEIVYQPDNYKYEFGKSTEVGDNVHYNKICFVETGTYRIFVKDNRDDSNDKYTEKGDYITVAVTPPAIGFYEGTTLSGKYLNNEYEYNVGDTFCVITGGDNVSLDGDGYGIFPDEDIFSEEEWNEMLEPGVEGEEYAYKITIPETCQEDFSVLVRAKVTKSKGEVENKEVSLNLVCDRRVLNAIRPGRSSEDNAPLDYNKTEKNKGRSVTMDLGSADHLYFYGYYVYDSNQTNISQIKKTESMELYYFDDSAPNPSFVKVTDEETYGTIQICTESGCADKNIFSVDLKKKGIYKVKDTSIAKYLGSNEVIIKTQYPKYGFYTADTVSAENLVWDDADYCYGSEEDDDYNRTLYFLKRDGAEGTITDVRAIWRGKDKTKEFIAQKDAQNGNGKEITINPACQQDFELQVYIDGEEKPQTIQIQYYDKKEPSPSRNDGQREKAFSGCMLTQQGYQIGSYDGRNCQPAEQHWVYGDSVQDVLDELVDIKTIGNTGYYYITMSCYTGNIDAEENQEKEQTVTLPEGVKGVVMDSGQEPEKAWGSANPNFDQDDCWDVYDIDGIYACHLEFGNKEEGASSLEDGWYQVVEESGIYVYYTEKPLDNVVDVPKPGSNEWNELSDIYQTVDKYFNWPNLVLDATTGHVPVKLEGQWAEQAGVRINYSDKKNTEFEVDVCGTKITKENATDSVTVKATNDEDITVSFRLVSCDHSGETEVKDAKDATCTETGYTGDTYCKDCGKKIKDGEDIPAIGHKWDTGKVTKPATETEKGVKTYTCQNGCGQTKTEEIPALGTKPGQPQPEQPKPQPKGTKIADPAGNTYKVTSDPQAKEPTVEYTAPKKDAKGTVKVPDSITVDGVVYKVTAIADNAFKGNKKVTKVTIGKNVISIGKNVFSGCTKLKSVTGGTSVTKIGDSAFKGCAALTKITLSAKVQKIGKNAFAGCKKLKMIIIKSTKLTTKSVSKGAFKGLTAKTTIKVPKSKLKVYRTLFRKKGLPKKVKVKA